MEELSHEKIEWLRDVGHRAINVLPGCGAFFKQDYLKSNSLTAEIFGGDFRDADGSISGLCESLGINLLYCTSLDITRATPSFSFFPSHANLKAVREEYHAPSHFVLEEKCTFFIVSDSDYYWGFASSKQIVSLAKKHCSRLILNRNEINGFIESKDPHNARIGEMLCSFVEICDLANDT